MALKKRKTMRSRFDEWREAHEGATLFLVAASVAACLIGVFLFVTFSGFGASAEFIYNQF